MAKVRFITYGQLVAKDACRGYREAFTELFPDGKAQVTPENAVKHAQSFDWYWAAEELLPTDLWRGWREDMSAAERELETVRARLRQVRREAAAKAENDLDDARCQYLYGPVVNRAAFDQAERAYIEAGDASYAAYEAASTKAQETFNETIALAFAQAYLACGPGNPRKDYARKLRGHYLGHLADMAECFSPDRNDSNGADFLDMVRDDVAELIEGSGTIDGDGVREEAGRLAREAVETMESRGTNGHWDAFRDLGAYHEDMSEFGPFQTLQDGLYRAMYQIAERLVHKLADEFQEALDAAPVEEDEDEDGGGSEDHAQ